jgi:hypothetical protein
MKIKHFNQTRDFLWDNRKKFLYGSSERCQFDFPDYAGMPRKLSNKLSVDDVDAIQQAIASLGKNWNKSSFSEELMRSLLSFGCLDAKELVFLINKFYW